MDPAWVRETVAADYAGELLLGEDLLVVER
jgi:hypothetical protein